MKHLETTRRGFIGGAFAMTGLPAAVPAVAAAEDPDVKLGVASYSLRKFSRQQAIAMIRQMNVKYVCIKEVHLPYDSTPEELAAARKQFEDAGLVIAGGGVIDLQKDDDADVRKYFEYAKQAGMPLMVIAPTHQTLPRIEKFVKQYDIKAAVHNHGPEDKHFPSPESALEAIRGMDPRVGVCVDVGHTARTGTSPVQAIEDAGSRLLDIHVKDLRSLADKSSQVPVGDGEMPVVAIFKLLKKMKYKGCVDLEYEIDADNPLGGMSKSFAYMRGVLAGLRG